MKRKYRDPFAVYAWGLIFFCLFSFCGALVALTIYDHNYAEKCHAAGGVVVENENKTDACVKPPQVIPTR